MNNTLKAEIFKPGAAADYSLINAYTTPDKVTKKIMNGPLMYFYNLEKNRIFNKCM